MIGKPVEYELLQKVINSNDVKESKKILDINDYKLTYWDELHKCEGKIDQEQFENMRYYYLHINRSLQRLDIPYINMSYYKRKNEEIPSNQKLARLVEACCYEDLYFYYFFEVIDSVFNIINKLLVLVNDSFKLNLNTKSNSNFEINIVKAIKSTTKLYSILEIKAFVNYLSNYSGSIYETCKENYRNQHVHDFTNEIPKYKIIDNSIVFEDSLKKDKSFEDCINLLKEFKTFISMIDKAIYSYLKDICNK